LLEEANWGKEKLKNEKRDIVKQKRLFK